MAVDRGHLLLACAIRQGLVGGDVALRIAGLADDGADLRGLLLGIGRLAEEQVRTLEAFCERERASRTHVPDPPQANVRNDATIAMPPPEPGDSTPATLPQLSTPRYVLGEEIGRGGIARVVEAQDVELGRRVALKVLEEKATVDTVERFRAEARVTGQLEHPNIVPVHEMGVLPATREVFLAMKRINGRDMRQVIREGGWKPRRLVEAFRDVCRAVAYAHSKGIIHRDLKPANVMLGDFGEVLVVDWGLARRVGPGAAENWDEGPEGAGGIAGLDTMYGKDMSSTRTPAGGVVGTPSYMSPEQAEGVIEVDERADVYSLGATLYEILAGRPPFESPSVRETLKLVLAGELLPPSSFREVPAELEAICLTALAYRREDRYGSVVELGSDVEEYLQGTKELERRHHQAEEQVSRAVAETARSKALQEEARAEMDRAQEEIAKLATDSWLEKARLYWRFEDRADARRHESIDAWAAADAALDMALTLDPGSRQARELKAGLHWDRFLQAERENDREGMLLSRRVVERFNDGGFDARLSGEGSLEIATRAWACACLREGRPVLPTELAVLGFHPWSGRALDGRPVEFARGMEPGAPVTLRVHGPGCASVAAPGARVWAWRYEPVDRILFPLTPGGSTPGLPDEVLDPLFGDSPYRPRGGGLYLGVTPIPKRRWPMGSWLLVVAPEGAPAFRVPVTIRRQEELRLELDVPRAGEIPEGFVRVPGGKFAWGGDRELPAALKGEIRELDEFLVARHPVTCAEYAAFLNDLARTDPAEAEARAPREATGAKPLWTRGEGGRYGVAGAARIAGVPVAWDENWPVLGISWADASAFARWRSLREGRLFFVPHEAQREKAARGTDGRTHPWGNYMYDRISNTNTAHDDGPHPAPVESFPQDESPYGVRGLGGNARDWCLNDPGGDMHLGWRTCRGGNWMSPSPAARCAYRAGAPMDSIQPMTTIRLASVLALPAGKEPWPLELLRATT